MSHIHHPIVLQDRTTLATLREAAAPGRSMFERAVFDAIIEQAPPHRGVRYEAATVGGVAGWWCKPLTQVAGAAIFYLHGGAYIVGTANAYRNYVGHIAHRAQRAAFIPDYPLAPGNPFPAALTNAEAAYAGLCGMGFGDLVLVGDCAGGGLALALTSRGIAGKSRYPALPPTRVAVVSPWTDLALTGATVETLADVDLLLTRDALAAAANQYLRGHDPADPQVSPLYANPKGLPPIRIDVGTDEILLDDSRRYAQHVASADGKIQFHIWEGMPHIFPTYIGVLLAADLAVAQIASFLRGGPA
jgi:epsilon-lactone hydrolase